MTKKIKKRSSKELPRSVLSFMGEPMVDPRDGHGARSARDLMILSKWKAFIKDRDRSALIDLINLAGAHDELKLKAARNTEVIVTQGRTHFEFRALEPAMLLLGMATVEDIEVAPERDGYRTVTKRKRIPFEEWFAKYALERPDVDPAVVKGVREWIENGSIQRPSRIPRDWDDD